MGLHFDPTINVGSILTVVVTIVALWRWSVTQTRREQKLDMILYGDIEGGIPGLVKDVTLLKDDRDDIYTHLHKLGIERRGLGPNRRKEH